MENQFNQVVEEKKKELNYIKTELAEALSPNGEPDYEYAFLLSSIRWSVENELRILESLRGIQENTSTLEFKSYIQKLLSGENQCLEFHISVGEHGFYEYHGPLLEISGVRKRSLKCNLLINDSIRGYLSGPIEKELKKTGWKQKNRKSPFTKNFTIKTKDDLSGFHIFIAKTLLEHYGHLIKETKTQYYILK